VEEKIDLNFLIKKKAEIEKEEEELVKKRAELIAIQENINNKIAKLTQLSNEIRAQMTIKKTVQEQKLKHIIKAYSAMKPQKAASLIEKMEITFAIELLSKMKGDVVGNILSFIETDKAVRMSEQLAKRK
jgi:flagellar motility protein MotE (MotC chaperone)